MSASSLAKPRPGVVAGVYPPEPAAASNPPKHFGASDGRKRLLRDLTDGGTRTLLIVGGAAVVVMVGLGVRALLDGNPPAQGDAGAESTQNQETSLGTPNAVTRGSEEHTRFLARCLEDAGFNVEWDSQQGTGIISADVADQRSAYDRAWTDCNALAETVLLVHPPETPSADRVGLWYDALQITYRCLVDHGYPTVPPPTREVFIEDYFASGSAWHPYDAVPEANLFALPSEPVTPAIVRGREIREACSADLGVLMQQLEGTP